MAYAAINTQAPMGAVAILRVVDGIRGLKDTVVAWNRARQSRKVLLRLSPEQLEDVGLTRSDLF